MLSIAVLCFAGGGLGGTRRGGPDQNVRHSGREEPSLAAAANRGM